MAEPVRFLDVLTTAAAVANYRGRPQVGPGDVLDALAILLGEARMEDLGRPVSPLVRRPTTDDAAEPAVRTLVQRWYAALGAGPGAILEGDRLAAFRAELEALQDESVSE